MCSSVRTDDRLAQGAHLHDQEAVQVEHELVPLAHLNHRLFFRLDGSACDGSDTSTACSGSELCLAGASRA